MEQYYTVKEAARILGIHEVYLRTKYLYSGQIQYVKLFDYKKSPVRIAKSELERILQQKMAKIKTQIDIVA